MRSIGAGTIALLGLAVLGCVVSTTYELPAEPPLHAVHVSGSSWRFRNRWVQDIVAELRPDIPIQTVADLSHFGELEPGMTLGELKAKLGSPVLSHDSDNETTTARFVTSAGPLSVMCGPCADERPATKLSLEPIGTLPLAPTFHAELVAVVKAAAIRRPTEAIALHVVTASENEQVSGRITGDRVVELTWGRAER